MVYYSLTFGDKNTWDDWKLIPTSRPVFSPPSVKTNYIDMPWSDGQVDLAAQLLQGAVYGNRRGSIDFIVTDQTRNWAEIYSEIMNYLHNQPMTVKMEEDPTFVYRGRFFVNEWRSDPAYSRIVIEYDVMPFKEAGG